MIISFFQHHENRKTRKNKVCPCLVLKICTPARSVPVFKVCPWLVLKNHTPANVRFARAESFGNIFLNTKFWNTDFAKTHKKYSLNPRSVPGSC